MYTNHTHIATLQRANRMIERANDMRDYESFVLLLLASSTRSISSANTDIFSCSLVISTKGCLIFSGDNAGGFDFDFDFGVRVAHTCMCL